ncbi:MAG: diaminohydroxyphosphoribosylaminopyrimidine deaminase [Planctomycetota bacterium]|jgi:diaminohydroxyphosphoribosylaminopyrimidine deaminase/5-amino-6-(5-phosphoribosylamino)uracil reductase
MDSTRILSVPSGGATDGQYAALLEELGTVAGEFRFEVAPNPCVGAIVLSDGVEIGRGFHERWGAAHAEINALAAAAKSGVARERWDTLLVTLEPCSSTDKTGPCVEAILEAGIKRVVVGELDPDFRHRGAGCKLLAERGVEVVLMNGPARLARVAPHFLRWTDPDRIRRRRPWVIAKWAQTRSGQLSPPAGVGDGRWISGPLAQACVQVLRGRVDAIISGSGTVLADDPRFSVRLPGDLANPPARVILDSELRTPPEARLFAAVGEDESAGPVKIVTRLGAATVFRRQLEEAGASIYEFRSGDDGKPSLLAIMEWLWDTGARRVLLEAGPKLVQAFFAAELIDQLCVYTGDVLGGRGDNLGKCLDPRFLSQARHGEIGEDGLLDAFFVR